MRPNLFAGMGAHQSRVSETDTWLTPPAIIEALGGSDSFDLDPCAGPDQPWSTARQHYTEDDDGLALDWFGRIWLNPPYSRELVAKFMRRMAKHDHGIALIFARTETDTFHRYVWEQARGLLFLRGRLNFHKPDGARALKNGGAPSVLIAYGADDCDILGAAPIDGAFVPLRVPVSMLVEVVSKTWNDALESWFHRHSGVVTLAEIYLAFVDHPKTSTNKFWQEKIRQVLQKGRFERVDKGVWRRVRI